MPWASKYAFPRQWAGLKPSKHSDGEARFITIIAAPLERFKGLRPAHCRRKGSTNHTLCGIVLFKLNIFCFRVWERSLVLILPVFCVCRVYRRSIFFSLVLILHIHAYLGIKGDQFFSDLSIFFGARFTYKLMYYNLYHVSDFTRNWMYRICM